MSDAVIVALITASATIVCQLLINYNNRKKQRKEDEEKERTKAVADAVKDERLENRLTNIEHNLQENNRKLDIHNGYAEKLGNIETSIAVIETEIKNLSEKGD